MKKILYLAIGLLITTVEAVSPQHHTQTVLDKTALDKAKRAVDEFVINAAKSSTCDDFNVFAQLLNYYRSEFGYQAVTPPPFSLQERATPAVQDLKAKIKAIVADEKSFHQEIPAGIVGGSEINEAGHQFFADLIAYVQKKACTIQVPAQASPRYR